MEKKTIFENLQGTGKSSYEIFLNRSDLLNCQTDFDKLTNKDQLQFQIVHQIEELWMKLIVYTLVEIDEEMKKKNTYKALTLFNRVHRLQKLMIDQLALLETMSPKDYQIIRQLLGDGSGKESPGFQTIIHASEPLYITFKEHYLAETSLEKIYNSEYKHGEAYILAEALVEFDELFQSFSYHHVQLVERSIGLGGKAISGNPITLLQNSLKRKFYPELWDIRNKMTDEWGSEYGTQREPLQESKN
jgi:tryptophan 2,3-dioxygenase